MRAIRKAEEIAREAHKNQKRWDGSHYIEHPKRVALSFNDFDCRIVGWLHDVLEDTDTTEQNLIDEGIPSRLVKSIKNLTKKEEENYYDFVMRIKNDPIATKVKIADIEDNLSDNLKEGSLKDKYRLARYILKN